jgi:hypothetical protein
MNVSRKRICNTGEIDPSASLIGVGGPSKHSSSSGAAAAYSPTAQFHSHQSPQSIQEQFKKRHELAMKFVGMTNQQLENFVIFYFKFNCIYF